MSDFKITIFDLKAVLSQFQNDLLSFSQSAIIPQILSLDVVREDLNGQELTLASKYYPYAMSNIYPGQSTPIPPTDKAVATIIPNTFFQNNFPEIYNLIHTELRNFVADHEKKYPHLEVLIQKQQATE